MNYVVNSGRCAEALEKPYKIQERLFVGARSREMASQPAGFRPKFSGRFGSSTCPIVNDGATGSTKPMLPQI